MAALFFDLLFSVVFAQSSFVSERYTRWNAPNMGRAEQQIIRDAKNRALTGLRGPLFDQIMAFQLSQNSQGMVRSMDIGGNSNEQIVTSLNGYESTQSASADNRYMGFKITHRKDNQETVIYQSSAAEYLSQQPSLSPDSKFLLIVLRSEYTTDFSSTLVFYDLQRGLMRRISKQVSATEAVSFASNTEVMYNVGLNDDRRMQRLNFLNDQTEDSNLMMVSSSLVMHETVLFDNEKNQITLLRAKYDRHDHLYLTTFSGELNGFEILDVTDGYTLLSYMDSATNEFRIVRVNQHSNYAFVMARLNGQNRAISHIRLVGGQIFYVARSQGRVSLNLQASDGRSVGQYSLPACCDVVGVYADSISKQVTVSVESHVRHQEIEFDTYRTLVRLDRVNLDEVMLKDDRNIRYESSVIMVENNLDRVQIPVRITHRAGLNKNGRNPVYMESYGGFADMGGLYPYQKTMVMKYVQAGGVYVAAGLRGGLENGPAWWSTAVRYNRHRTLTDLISVANAMVRQGYTSSDRIVSYGASHGGFVVTAAALMSPQSFGLVIPLNGVMDFIGIEPRWTEEYGDPTTSEYKAYYRSISPLEIEPNLSQLRFFIVVGKNDERVRPAHSYKIHDRLKTVDASKVEMLQVQQGGHLLNSSWTQGELGLFTDSAIWTKIFQFSRLSFPNQ